MTTPNTPTPGQRPPAPGPQDRYELPLVPREDLAKKAYKDCERHLKSVTDKKITVEPKGAAVAWEPETLRAVYEADFVLWRPWKKMDVLVDESDRAVGFVDHGKLAPMEWKPMTQAEVVELASATGYVPAASRVLSMSAGPGGCIEARLATAPTSVDSPRYLVRVNPLRKAVIAIAPEGAEL